MDHKYYSKKNKSEVADIKGVLNTENGATAVYSLCDRDSAEIVLNNKHGDSSDEEDDFVNTGK